MSTLPFHPITGLQALGFTSRGPIWPVMGAAEDGGDGGAGGGAPAGEEQQQQSDQGDQSGNSDKGFPENVHPDQMTLEQQNAYYKHLAKKHEGRYSGWKGLGLTPDQVRDMQAENEQLKDKELNADQKASKQAIKDAEAKGRTEAESVWKPKYQQAMLRSVAGEIISGDQLNAFMGLVDMGKVTNEDGEIDKDAVMVQLTALYGQSPGGSDQQNNGQQHNGGYQWGQHGGRPPGEQPGQSGRAEAARRRERRGANA